MALTRAGLLIPATVEGLSEPTYLAAERLPDLKRLRSGALPAPVLFGYEVCFEAYVVPEKRR